MENEIKDRRERARKAFEECPIGEHDCTSCRRDRAIEVATQVKITADMTRILTQGGASDVQDLRDIFRAAGFEVIE